MNDANPLTLRVREQRSKKQPITKFFWEYDVLSAVEGLKNVRYFFVEDGRNCSRCDNVRFTWVIPDKSLPEIGRHELEMCAHCWNNYWFPVFKGEEMEARK